MWIWICDRGFAVACAGWRTVRACLSAPFIHSSISPRTAQLKETTKQASISTASLGRYDRVVRGEKMADRKLPGKKKALPPLASKVRDVCGYRFRA